MLWPEVLWRRCWTETRWRFLIGLLIVICSSASVVLTWPRIAGLLPAAAAMGGEGEIGRRIREAVEVQRTWPGFIWSQAFAQNLTNMTTLFATLLGVGGLLSASSGSALFTLSMPVTRRQITWTRAATGLAELLIIAFAGSFAVSIFSPTVGESYPFTDALGHGICLWAACAVFFAVASLLSTIFTDFWRPLVVALVAALALGGLELASRGLGGYGLFYLMSGEGWFRNAEFPWLAIPVSLTVTAVLLWLAARNTEQHDF
jgi:hypothetical protein